MAWRPKGLRSKALPTKASLAPVSAALIGGVLAITGALLGTLLTIRSNNESAERVASAQRQKEQKQSDDAAIRALLNLAARSVSYANQAADLLEDGKEFKRETPEPHEALIDEAMLFSPVLSHDTFELASKIIQVIGTAQICKLKKQNVEFQVAVIQSTDKSAALLRELGSTQRSQSDCRQSLVNERDQLLHLHKRFRETVWESSRLGSPATPLTAIPTKPP